MRKGGDILNKQLVTFADGRQIAKIHDLIFDHKKNTVLGFLVDEGGWFSSAKVLSLQDVKSIGEDAVVVQTESAVVSADDRPEMTEVLKSNNILKGTKLMTESGKAVGTLVDLYFDEVSGRVEGYEVSGGLFADMYNGRSMVPAGAPLRMGQDVAFMSDATLEMLENQVGGIKGAAQSAGAAVSTTAHNVSGKAQEYAGTVTTKVGDLKDQATATATSSETGAKVDSAKDAVQDKATELKEGASSLWETVKGKAGEYKDQATQKIEETRINRALGKPASRVVLDKNDHVLLNVGDIITHESVEKARMAGELEVLLGSVYEKGPELSTDDMKAKTEGETTV